ncbi:MAG: TetR/AcrR family transcriptional regulator [Desulfatiglandales bacterium]
MPRPDTHKRFNKLLKVASRILSTKGYDKTSLSDIASATGLTKPGLYYYVDSKEQLLFFILDSYMNKLLEGIKGIKENVKDPKEFLLKAIEFQVNLYKSEPYVSKLIIHDENCLSGRFFKVIKEKQREYINYWKDAIIELREQFNLNIDFPSVYTHILVGMCNWIYQWYNVKGKVKPEELAEKIYNLYFNGIMSQSNCRENKMD